MIRRSLNQQGTAQRSAHAILQQLNVLFKNLLDNASIVLLQYRALMPILTCINRSSARSMQYTLQTLSALLWLSSRKSVGHFKSCSFLEAA